MTSYANVTALYVSAEKGNASFTGVSPVNDKINNGPVPTIAAAMYIVAGMRRVGYFQPVVIRVMDDVTVMDRPVEIGAAGPAYHDPAQLSDVTVEPYGEGKKLISGGRRIEGFKEDTFMGVKCFSAFIPEVKEGKWSFTDLYVDRERASMTRYPESGYFQPEDVENHGRQLGSSSSWFIAKEGDINPAFKNIEDAVISFGHYWIDEHTPIKSFDPVTRKVEFEYPTCFSISPEAGGAAVMDYWLDNVAEAFKNPGEWYLDRPEGMLYYIPKYPHQTVDNIEVYAPLFDRLFTFKGDIAGNNKLRGIKFRNLQFAYTKGEYRSERKRKNPDGTEETYYLASDGQSCCGMHGAFNFEGCTGCELDNVDIFCCGTGGVVFGAGCNHMRVTHSSITNGGGGGVRIAGGGSGSEEKYHTHDIVVSDCEISNLGNRYFAADGVLIMNAYHCEISHNNIHGMYYSAVCVGWVWGYAPSVTRGNLITKNHIWDLGRGRLSDMGGVYLLGGQPGTVVSGNLIHDVKSKNYGGWALYTDEGSSYITLENNVCYNVSENCYHQHYGSMNTVRNNVFAYAGHEAIRVTRRENHEGLLIENNIILCKDGSPVYGNATAMVVYSNRNLIWDESGKAPVFYKSGETSYSHGEIKEAFGWDKESIVKNPRFKDAKNFDFTLRKDSPAGEIGFKPIDLSDVGPRK